MKRKVWFCLVFFLLTWLLVLPVVGEEGGEATVSEKFSDLESILPEDIAALLPDGFFDVSPTAKAEGVRRASRFSYLIGVVGNLIGLQDRKSVV